MPKTETQIIKSQSLKAGDVLVRFGAQVPVETVDPKTKWVLVNGTNKYKIERDDDVQVQRTVPTAAEKYDDLKTRVVDEICDEVRRAKAGRDKARAKLVEHINGDYRINYFELGSLAEADARWEIFVHLSNAMDEAADDDRMIELARHLIDQETEKLLADRYSGSSSSQMSNALDAHRRKVAAELVGRHGFGLALYLTMLDKAAADRDAEAAASE